jgi:hypothetical protein
MGLFGKRQQNTGGMRLPADFARTLEQYGRWTFDPPGSGIDPGQIGCGNIKYEFFMLAQDDSDAFIRAVAAVALPAGEWALYGGSRAVWNAVGTDVEHPDYLALLDASIDFIGRRYGMAYLAPYEIRRLEQTRGEAEERTSTPAINESER